MGVASSSVNPRRYDRISLALEVDSEFKCKTYYKLVAEMLDREQVGVSSSNSSQSLFYLRNALFVQDS